jgi:hypothetical protein
MMPRWLVWILAGSCAIAMSVQAWLWTRTDGWGWDLLIPLLILAAFAVFAFWLTLRVPENRVSWVLSLGISSSIVNQVAYDYFDLGRELGLSGAAGAFVVHNSLLWAGMALLVAIPLLFPTGILPSPRWRWVGWMAAIGVVPQIAKALYLATSLPLGELEDQSTGLGWLDIAYSIGQGLIAIAAAAALIALVIRFVKSEGIERRQMLYVLPSIFLLVGFWIVESIQQESAVALIMLGLGGLTLPISMGLSILKYRLYDIDRVVSRTVSYILIVGFLGIVFTAGVVWIPSLLDLGDSPVLVAASTLAVAALFNPVRKRVQNWVDRRFNRARYDSQRVMGEFAGSLQGQVDPEDVVDGWVDVVSETMQPSSIGVWVREQ